MKIFKMFLILFFITSILNAQKDTHDSLYIPIDLSDAHQELMTMLSEDELIEFKNTNEKDVIVMYHFGLGMWIRNNWKLWRGSRLSEYFDSLGVSHPDDISGIILQTFWYKLNNQPQRLEEQIKYCKLYWEADKDPINKFCSDDSSEFEIKLWLTGETDDGNPECIHVGYCKKNNHLWVYEHDKGWYKPDSTIIKRIQYDRPGHPCPRR